MLVSFFSPSEPRRHCGLCKPESSKLYSGPEAFQKDNKTRKKMVKVDCCALQLEYCVGEDRGLKCVVCLKLATPTII